VGIDYINLKKAARRRGRHSILDQNHTQKRARTHRGSIGLSLSGAAANYTPAPRPNFFGQNMQRAA
jgi:hypothetical protein